DLAGQVVGNGLAAQAQVVGNLTRRKALGQHDENLELTWRHALQARIEPAVIRRTGKLDGQLLLYVAVTSQAALHGLDQHLPPRPLGDETHGAGRQGLAHQRQLIVHAEEQDTQQRPALQQTAGGLDSADARQADLEDHQVRYPLLDCRECLLAIARFENAGLRILRREQAAVALPDNEVIIQQQNMHTPKLP